MGEMSPFEESQVLEKSELKKPSRYKVILHNDDYTTMEFVVYILMEIFKKSEAEAFSIMIMVHEKERGIAGIYSREIAETKIERVRREAKEAGFPLLCTMEKE